MNIPMLALLIASILLTVLLVGIAVRWKRELPESISAMVYLLPHNLQWLWIVGMWVVTLLTAPALLEAMPADKQYVAFAAIVPLMFVGAMPLVADEPNTAHYVLAIASGVLTQVCVLILCPALLICWVVVPWLFLNRMAAEYPFEKRIVEITAGKMVFVTECVCWFTLNASVIVHRIASGVF